MKMATDTKVYGKIVIPTIDPLVINESPYQGKQALSSISSFQTTQEFKLEQSQAQYQF